MENKVCFLFGHASTPHDCISRIEAAAEYHYRKYGIRTFIVGNRGNFDQLAATAIRQLKKKYPDITLLLLLAYHPGERAVCLGEGYDNAYYPPLEHVPRQYAIVRANQYMVDTADSVICYAKYVGNSRNLLEYARKQQKKRGIAIENVAEV